MIGTANKIIRFLLEQKPEQEWKITKHHKARSLSQNALYWEVCEQVARKLKESKTVIHNRMLRDFGQYEYICGQLMTTYLPDTDEVEEQTLRSMTYHLKPTSKVVLGSNGKMFRAYIILRGSHEYDTEEMARLIDGMKQEAAQQGIHLEEVQYG